VVFQLRSAYERETIINFNEDEKQASVYTFNQSLKKRLKKFAIDRPDECKMTSEGPEDAASFLVPKKWVRIKPPAQYNLTDEQKQERAERMRRIHKEKQVSDEG
jgi:hypothetical protein